MAGCVSIEEKRDLTQSVRIHTEESDITDGEVVCGGKEGGF